MWRSVHKIGSIRRFWDKEESLTFFLWLLSAFIFIVIPLSKFNLKLRALVTVFLGMVIVSGIWATFSSKKKASVAVGLVVVALTFSEVLLLFAEGRLGTILIELCTTPVLILFLYVTLKQTMKRGHISSHRIKGAVASYLLFGVVWAKLYNLIELIVPGSISGVDTANPLISLIYFSFVTLTTLGYGDILPVNEVTRTLSNVEALIGQLFPAIFIARLVSLEVDERKARAD